jgi:hypothetical protein
MSYDQGKVATSAGTTYLLPLLLITAISMNWNATSMALIITHCNQPALITTGGKLMIHKDLSDAEPLVIPCNPAHPTPHYRLSPNA